MFQWLHKRWVSSAARFSRGRRSGNRRSALPLVLEQLENRIMLTNYYFQVDPNAVFQDFNDPANWRDAANTADAW